MSPVLFYEFFTNSKSNAAVYLPLLVLVVILMSISDFSGTGMGKEKSYVY